MEDKQNILSSREYYVRLIDPHRFDIAPVKQDVSEIIFERLIERPNEKIIERQRIVFK